MTIAKRYNLKVQVSKKKNVINERIIYATLDLGRGGGAHAYFGKFNINLSCANNEFKLSRMVLVPAPAPPLL